MTKARTLITHVSSGAQDNDSPFNRGLSIWSDAIRACFGRCFISDRGGEILRLDFCTGHSFDRDVIPLLGEDLPDFMVPRFPLERINWSLIVENNIISVRAAQSFPLMAQWDGKEIPISLLCACGWWNCLQSSSKHRQIREVACSCLTLLFVSGLNPASDEPCLSPVLIGQPIRWDWLAEDITLSTRLHASIPQLAPPVLPLKWSVQSGPYSENSKPAFVHVCCTLILKVKDLNITACFTRVLQHTAHFLLCGCNCSQVK